MSSEVSIPEAVWDVVLAATPDAPFEARADQQAAVEAAAPLIVAAELERMAELIDNAPYPYEELLHRAKELRASVLRGEGGRDGE